MPFGNMTADWAICRSEDGRDSVDNGKDSRYSSAGRDDRSMSQFEVTEVCHEMLEEVGTGYDSSRNTSAEARGKNSAWQWLPFRGAETGKNLSK